MTKSNIIEKIFSNSSFENSKKITEYKNPTNDINNNNSNFTYATPIIQDNYKINCIPSCGILINKEGNYKFGNNIHWKPTQNAIAITITTSNVTLDFCNYKLTNKSNCNYNLIGINAFGNELSSIYNLSIINSKIKNMSYYGIQIMYCEGLNLNNIIINKINYSNLDIRNLTPSGIFIQYTNNSFISDCKVKNIDVKTDSTAGIQLIECNNSIITKCKIIKLINRDGAVQGYSYIGCQNITTILCKSINFRSFFKDNILTTGHTVLGFIPIFCANLLYENCLSKKMIGSCDDVHGISVFFNIFVQLKNFKIDYVLDGNTPSKTGAKSTGIEVYGIFIKIMDCDVKNIFAIRPQDKQSAGFASGRF
jgi:hypothetical protein